MSNAVKYIHYAPSHHFSIIASFDDGQEYLSSAELTETFLQEFGECLWFARIIVPRQIRRRGMATMLMTGVEKLGESMLIVNVPNFYGEGDGQFYLDWMKRRGWIEYNGIYLFGNGSKKFGES